MAGCSSSSNTIRYGSDNKNDNSEEPPVRYSKDKKKNSVENKILTETEADMDNEPDNLTSVDVSVIEQKYHSKLNTESSVLRERMLMEIIKYMNTPYKFGGNSKDGIDCSAFTQTVFGSCSLQLLRSAKEQYTQGITIISKENLKFGDLVFFDTRKSARPGHVGIYIGDDLFVHASSKHGVIVTPLSHEYYQKRFMGAKRIEESLGFQ
jgi:cell wall-associated NlpC family hydrolase